jgi:hypothetical protein
MIPSYGLREENKTWVQLLRTIFRKTENRRSLLSKPTYDWGAKALFVYAVKIVFQLKHSSQVFSNIKNIKCLVISKTLKMTGGTHVNSCFKRDIREAAPGCFFKFCIYAHSASEFVLFACTVQVNCTVPVNSAIHLHCSGIFFLYSVYSFCIFFLKKN